QAAAFDERRKELLEHGSTRAKTLDQLVRSLQAELHDANEQFPKELQVREQAIAQLNKQLADGQARHQQQTSRYERVSAALEKRGLQKEQALRAQVKSQKDEWTQKLAGRDAEIAALQADLLAKYNERPGELDRMAKQFAEERFQLEKSKEELEWKLKDHKEVAERQLSGRAKEAQFLEGEIK